MVRRVLAFIILLASLPVSAKTLMIFGDSISAAYGIDVGQGWVQLVQNKLQSEKINYTVVNESISGDTTAGGLARIDQALISHKPDVVILELGANDGLRGLAPGMIKTNLSEIIDKVNKSGSKVLLLSMRIPPNYGKRYTETFYGIYPELAKAKNIPFVPFILEDVALVKQLMQADGLHPNAEAQAVIVEKIWPHLSKLLD